MVKKQSTIADWTALDTAKKMHDVDVFSSLPWKIRMELTREDARRRAAEERSSERERRQAEKDGEEREEREVADDEVVFLEVRPTLQRCIEQEGPMKLTDLLPLLHGGEETERFVESKARLVRARGLFRGAPPEDSAR